MTPPLNILLISHDASRTGAPILLLHLARLLQAKGHAVSFLLKRGGDLNKDFSAIASVHYYYKPVNSTLLGKIGKRLFKEPTYSLRELEWDSFDLVISNTITNGDLLPEVRRFYQGPLLTYVHELEMAAGFFTTPERIAEVIKYSDGFLTPCETLSRFLIRRFNIQRNKITVLPYYIPLVTKPGGRPEKKSFIAGSTGTVDWRKSPDLFVQVARTVFTKEPEVDILFQWKGAPKGGIDLERVMYDVRMAGLEGKIQFLPASADVQSFYASLDLFLLTSREDPYPLVVLEAAHAGAPSVCFDGAGGSPEFVSQSGGGKIVPYLDTTAMADAVLYFYHHYGERLEAGRQAQTLLQQTHQSPDYVYHFFETIIHQYAGKYAE